MAKHTKASRSKSGTTLQYEGPNPQQTAFVTAQFNSNLISEAKQNEYTKSTADHSDIREKRATPSKVSKGVPGRPRLGVSESSAETRRRVQLRRAQTTYHRRKQHEFSLIKKQNAVMREGVSSLGISLTQLLDQMINEDLLQDRPVLAQHVASSARNILDFSRAIEDFEAFEEDKNTKVVPESETCNALPETVGEDFGNKMEGSETLRSNKTPVNSSQYPSINSQTALNSHPSVEAPAETFPFATQQLPIHGTSSTKNPAWEFHDWLSADSMLLAHDYAMDPYSISRYLTAPLSERLHHSALARASWILQDPTSTMQVVHKIFPFDKDPGPIHVQLLKINHLLLQSHPQIHGGYQNPVSETFKAVDFASDNRYAYENNVFSIDWDTSYPSWMSAHDVERYLVNRWNMFLDAEEANLMAYDDDTASRIGQSSIQQAPSDQILLSNSENGTILAEPRVIDLNVPDIIQGIILEGICFGNSPAFERRHVDQVIDGMIRLRLM